MILVKDGKDTFHYGLTEHGGLVLHLELSAIFINGSQFLVIQIDGVSVRAFEGRLLLVQVVRIHVGQGFLLALHCG